MKWQKKLDTDKKIVLLTKIFKFLDLLYYFWGVPSCTDQLH